MLVTTRYRTPYDPGSTIKDYAAWRKLAVAVRRDVIRQHPPGWAAWLDQWADPDALTDMATLKLVADPSKAQVEDLRYPHLPADGGLALALGAARIFTDKIPSLVRYTVDGDAMIAEATDPELIAARARKAKPDRATGDGKDPLWWVVPTAVGAGLAAVAGGAIWIARKFRGGRE